jgi:23S rRNA (uracil1939-C5)-methyltransferase
MSKKKKFEPFIIPQLHIYDAGSEGKAVGKTEEGLTVFVPFAVPEDVVKVKVFKKKKNYAEADLIEVIKPSSYRIRVQCEHYGICGGCKWQAMDYEKQLIFKQKQVDDNFAHLGKFDYPSLLPILASEKIFFYRNKLEFTFTSRRWLDEKDMIIQKNQSIETRGLGFHIPGKFDKVLDIQKCYLQNDFSNTIRNAVKEYALQYNLSFYDAHKHDGLLRNLIIRNNQKGEWMVILVFGEESPQNELFLQFLAERFPEIISLHYVVNSKLNDTINDLDIKLFKGSLYITEKMEELTFRISPLSFYQTNGGQAERLYRVVREFAGISSEDIVYDLYTGTGTIANFVARQAKKVVGIEYVEAAITDAKENSKINGIENTAFFAGDMAKIFTDEFIEQNGKPSIIITDPPRNGMHPKVIEQLLKIQPEKIIYVSCNPATQVRDINLLSEKYTVRQIQAVDMFPHTQHVENVVELRYNHE